MCYSTADACRFWFIQREDGQPIKEDLVKGNDNWETGVHHHSSLQFPFSVSEEKAATRIQMRFRECMSNPAYTMCRRRLRREFADLTTEQDAASAT